MTTKKKATKKKATKKKITKKKTPAIKYNFVAVDKNGYFYACTEQPIFANGKAYWPCPDGNYASYGKYDCCEDNTPTSKENTPTAKIKIVDTLDIHFTLVDDDSCNNKPYIFEFAEYMELLKAEKSDPKGCGKKPTDVYRTAF